MFFHGHAFISHYLRSLLIKSDIRVGITICVLQKSQHLPSSFTGLGLCPNSSSFLRLHITQFIILISFTYSSLLYIYYKVKDFLHLVAARTLRFNKIQVLFSSRNCYIKYPIFIIRVLLIIFINSISNICNQYYVIALTTFSSMDSR